MNENNLVKYKDKIHKIIGANFIDKRYNLKDVVSKETRWIDLHEIKKIKLTKDWFLKFGFIKSLTGSGDDSYHIMDKEGFSCD